MKGKTSNFNVSKIFFSFSPFHVCFECMSIVPLAPQMIPEDCSAENNSVTVAWQAPNHSFVQGYVLELDDGSGGEFRVSTTFSKWFMKFFLAVSLSLYFFRSPSLSFFLFNEIYEIFEFIAGRYICLTAAFNPSLFLNFCQQKL